MADTAPDPAAGPQAPGPPDGLAGGPAGRVRAWRVRRRAKKARRSKLRRRLTRVGIAVVVIIVASAGSLYGYARYLASEVHIVKVKHLQRVATKGKAKGVEDILLVGSTSRCALKTQNPAFGLCQDGVNGVNSDVVMVVRLNPNTHRVTLLSVPRDTFIPNARPDEYNRIDSALAYGPSQLVAAIEYDLGVPINHYVVLNFDTFANVVTALGGVHVYFPDRLYDNYSQLDITHTGCVFLDGFQALALVRARHLYYWTAGQTMDVAAIKAGDASASGAEYDGSGDIGRIERDHIFLKILAGAVAKRGLGNPLADNALLSAVVPQLGTDSTFSLGDMLNLALTFRGTDLATSPETTLPVIEDTQTYIYKGYDYGDIVFPTEPQDQRAIDAFMGTGDPGRAVLPKDVTVSVVGGIGDLEATLHTVRQLRRIGYQVLGHNEQTPVGPISETSVLYSPGHLVDAQRVLSSLAGAVALGTGPTTHGAEVTIVTGTDFQVRPGALENQIFTTTGTAASTAAPASKLLTPTQPPGTAVRAAVALLPSQRPISAQGPVDQAAHAIAPAATPVSLDALIAKVVATSSPTGYADNGALAPATPSDVAIPPYDPRACPARTATTAKTGKTAKTTKTAKRR